uniref:Retinoblastoma-like protein 1 n=1 Tax=Ciona intestinalis TaxID=7719 RepID=F6WPF5_CIOIN
MSSGDESDEDEQRFRDLCLAVNMDKPTMESAWRSYENAKENYTLEGDCLHWLTCTLYSACRTNLSSVKTIAGKTAPSNCISLTKLLREAKLSFISFLKKMDKWLQMNQNDPLSSHVSALERSFHVSTVVFKKYQVVFKYVFLDPDDSKYQRPVRGSAKNPSRPRRNRQYRKLVCNPHDVFNFCWTLFVHYSATEFRSISDEIVLSYQLLLSAINLCYNNALNCSVDHRAQLLNPKFPGLPADWSTRTEPLTQNQDIIALLVEQQPGTGQLDEKFLIETRVVNVHNWGKHVNSLLESEYILTCLVLFDLFLTNSSAISKLYEEYVITEGDFDERVFLHDEVDSELGTPIKCPPPAQTNLKQEVAEHLAKTNSMVQKTPLTNREYLHGKGHNSSLNGSLTPVSSTCHDVMKLKKLLQSKTDGPSEKLAAIFRECTEDPSEEVKKRTDRLREIIKKKYMERGGKGGGIPAGTPAIAEQRATMATVLYYHILEGSMIQEKKRLNGKSDLSELLKRDDFHTLLFACCVEIVLCSYKAERMFPWILSALDLSPYYFYKVIELVIRAEDGLWGPCIKHLNHIEEQILESLAWKSDSTLWQVLGNGESPAPLCEEHIEPSSADKSTGVNKGLLGPGTPKSPPTHPRVKAVSEGEIGNLRKFGKLDILKTEPGTARDRFSSPSPGSAKRRLFVKDHLSSTPGTLELLASGFMVAVLVKILEGYNVRVCQLSKQTKTFMNQQKVVSMDVPNSPGAKTYVVQQTSPETKSKTFLSFALKFCAIFRATLLKCSYTNGSNHADNVKPRKTGSLALFFRKVYHLASVRLRHLCEQLVIPPDLRAKIWTCFEYSVSKHAYSLMRDRHIDQMLMCAVYVIAKITQHDHSFQEIMRCYRSQPQATSNVYRNVLIHRSSSPRLIPAQPPSRSMRSNSTIPRSDPSSPLPGSTGGGDGERDDLIQFYNKVYVPVMREYVKKFNSGDVSHVSMNRFPLSPMPRPRILPQSPRKVTDNIYISPLKNPSLLMATNTDRHLDYNFHRSPAKRLRDINSMMQRHAPTLNGKRTLEFSKDEDGSEPKRANVSRRVQLMQRERSLPN